MDPFIIDVPDVTLDDLRRRLVATRWPAELPEPGWAYGMDLDVLRGLVEYWLDGFDWRAQERRLNRLAQHKVDGIHFVRERGAGPDSFPLVITNGWPSAFAELADLIPLLTHPDDPADAFDVVVPSIPGYGFSDRTTAPGQALARQVAARWAALMGSLGYARFGAVGTDLGSGITARLGMHHADRVVGIHLDPDGLWAPVDRSSPDLSPAEREFLQGTDGWDAEEAGYSHLQGTKPRTLAFGLTDSPVGLAAYIVEKFQAWSDCDGDVLSRFTRDQLLTIVTIYWATGTIGSSFLPYYESRHNPVTADRVPVEVPVAVALWPGDDGVWATPREYAERCYNIERWTPMPRGGHFAAMEEPELYAADIREFFRPLRAKG